MSELKKTVQIQEGILYPISFRERDLMGKLRPLIFLLDGILILISLLLWKNLFMEMSSYSRVALGVISLVALFTNVNKWGPSDLQISFYDDQMVLFRDHVCRGKGFYRREIDCMLYKDMKECKYRKSSKKIEIYGVVTVKQYEYDKTGMLKQRPCRDKVVNAMMWFYIQYTDVQRIIQDIEQNTPLKVIERET